MYEEVQKKLQELLRLTNKVLPVKAGKAVRDSVRENFRKGGQWHTQASPLRTHLGIAGPGYGPLLSGISYQKAKTR